MSVIVCCYNSSLRLPETIRHLAMQKTGYETAWEILLIDNASTDATSRTALAEWKKYNCPAAFRIVSESAPGLSAARSRGLAESQYEFLLFCDDDNWLQEDYIQTGYDILDKSPAISVLGGRSTAVFETDPPVWFPRFALSFAVGDQYPETGDVTLRHKKLWGAGCFFRKSTLRYLYDNGFRQMMTDRIGNRVVSGGDHELCYAVRLAGFRLYYEDRLYLQHYIPAGRATWDWYLAFFTNAAFFSLYFDPYDQAIQAPRRLKSNAAYQIYLSLRKLLDLTPSVKELTRLPEPASDDRSFAIFYEKQRIFGLIKHGWNYRRRLAKIGNAKWLKRTETVTG